MFDTSQLTRLLDAARDLTGPDTDSVNSEYVRGQMNLICDLAGLSGDEYGDLITAVIEHRESMEGALAVIANCEEAKPAEPPVAVSWVTTEVREYRHTFTPAELRAVGLTVTNGQLAQTAPPRSHWETPDRFLASREGPAAQKTGYIESRTVEASPAWTEAGRVPGRDESATLALIAGPDRLDQMRRLIVQAGTKCTHLAAIAPDGPAAARQATEIIGLLNQVRDLAGGPPAAGEDPAAQLAARVETATQALRDAAGAGPLSGESAATVAGSLGAALGHIADTLWPAVSGALPHAARHLDVAATRIGLTADLISTGISAAAASGRAVDFPGAVKPAAPGPGRASLSPAAATGSPAANPAKSRGAR